MQIAGTHLISSFLTRICPADGTVGPVLEYTEGAATPSARMDAVKQWRQTGRMWGRKVVAESFFHTNCVLPFFCLFVFMDVLETSVSASWFVEALGFGAINPFSF